jgi:hypothetical protein
MNTYSLAADSRRWWWLPATGGVIGTAAITAILAVPATSTVAPPEPPTTPTVTDSVTVVERPCYLAHPDWNTVEGWEDPVCKTILRRPADQPDPGRGRPAPDYLP